VRLKQWPGEGSKPPCDQSLPHRSHEVLIKVQIMQRIQACRENLAGNGKMTEIGPREVSTGVTATLLINRALVGCVGSATDIHLSQPGEQGTIACIPRRQDTIKEIKA
jgi:hypothetical protein